MSRYSIVSSATRTWIIKKRNKNNRVVDVIIVKNYKLAPNTSWLPWKTVEGRTGATLARIRPLHSRSPRSSTLLGCLVDPFRYTFDVQLFRFRFVRIKIGATPICKSRFRDRFPWRGRFRSCGGFLLTFRLWKKREKRSWEYKLLKWFCWNAEFSIVGIYSSRWRCYLMLS